MPGIEPGASHMRSVRSTTELHPQLKELSLQSTSNTCNAKLNEWASSSQLDRDVLGIFAAYSAFTAHHHNTHSIKHYALTLCNECKLYGSIGFTASSVSQCKFL